MPSGVSFPVRKTAVSARYQQSGSSLGASQELIRSILELALPTDAQLEAFCIDYFPAVQRQFSGQMERTRKLNLLLCRVPTAALLDVLQRLVPETVAQAEAACPHRLGSLVRAARSFSRPAVAAIGVISALLIALVAASWSRCWPWRLAARPNPMSRAQLSLSNSTQEAAGTFWLTSDPLGALVIEATSGRVLGQTPWNPSQSIRPWSVSNGKLHLCLRHAGFISAAVTIDLGSRSPIPMAIPLKRVIDSARQSNPTQEECNAPTPIVP